MRAFVLPLLLLSFGARAQCVADAFEIAQQSKIRDTRLSAQLQLVFSLQSSKPGLTAVRLFDDAARLPVTQLDAQARYLLGGMALDNNQPLTAAGYWQGMSAPSSLDPDEWRMRLVQTLVRAGVAGAGADALRALITGRKTLSVDLMRRSITSVQELQDPGNYKSADELYRALLPLAEVRERRNILVGLGRIAEANYDFQRAADYFLEAALLLDAIWPVLVLIGVESVEIAPGDTAFTPLHFAHYPISHSLLMAVVWAVLFGGIYWAIAGVRAGPSGSGCRLRGGTGSIATVPLLNTEL